MPFDTRLQDVFWKIDAVYNMEMTVVVVQSCDRNGQQVNKYNSNEQVEAPPTTPARVVAFGSQRRTDQHPFRVRMFTRK